MAGVEESRLPSPRAAARGGIPQRQTLLGQRCHRLWEAVHLEAKVVQTLPALPQRFLKRVVVAQWLHQLQVNPAAPQIKMG